MDDQTQDQALQKFLLLSTDVLRSTASHAVALLSAYPLPALFSSLRARAVAGDEAGASLRASALSRLLADPATVACLDGSVCALLIEAFSAPALAVRLLPARLLHALCRGALPWPAGMPRGALAAGGGALLGALVDGVADAEPSIAEVCGDAVVALAAGAPTGEELVVLTRALCRLHRSEPVRDDTSVMLRVLGVAARVAGTSDAACAALGAGEGGSALGDLLAACGDEGDPLLQLNSLEQVGFLGGSEGGLRVVSDSTLMELLFLWGTGECAEGEGAAERDVILAGAALDALAALYAAAVKGGGGGGGGGGGEPAPRAAALRARLLPALLRTLAGTCRDAAADVQATCATLRALLTVTAADPAPLLGALLSQAATSPPPAQALRQWFELCESSDAELRAAALGALAALLRVGGGGGGGAAPLLLRVFTFLSVACRGGAPPADLAEGLFASVAVVAGALGRRVPPLGVQAESEGAPHLARWAAYNVLEALCALPDAEGARAVFSTPGLGAALLAEGGEASLRGRAHAQAVVAAALGNPAVEALGPEFSARLRESAAASRGEGQVARAAAREVGVAVAEKAS
jgi:hypothetical protein